jgi:HSP20 family protein
MDRRLEDFGHGLSATSANDRDGFIIPKVDVAETEAGLEQAAKLSGFDEKDMSLDIHDSALPTSLL